MRLHTFNVFLFFFKCKWYLTEQILGFVQYNYNASTYIYMYVYIIICKFIVQNSRFFFFQCTSL